MPDPITFVSLQELGHPKPRIEEAIQLVRTLNKEAALTLVTRINVDLCLAGLSRDPETRNKTQERIISNIISERRLNELKEKVRAARVDQRPLVHRAQLLLAIKLILAFAQDNGGNQFRTRDEGDVLGELALIINSLFDFENLRGLDAPTLAREVAAQMSPLFELNNPEPLGNGMIRMHTMLGELYTPHSWQKVLRTDVPNVAGQLERIFTIATGMNFTEAQDLTFAIHAFYNGHAAEILAGTKDLVMRPDHADNAVSARWLRRCLDNASFDLDTVRVDSVDRGRPYLLDYTLLRQYPIWRINPDQYVCIDPYFVVERLVGGTYWTIINALAGPTPEDAARTLACSRLWGRLFEAYVLRTLADIYGTSPLSPYRPQPCYDDGEEAFDASIQIGTTLIVVQIKGLYTPLQAKASGTGTEFFAGINDKFGIERGAALEQHVRNIGLVFARDAARRRHIDTIPRDHVRSIIPVVITQEPLLRFGLVTNVLADAFAAALAAGEPLLGDIAVHHPIFLAIDELASLAPYLIVGDLSLAEALRVKGRGAELLSFWEAFRQEYLVSGKLPHRDNHLLEERWHELSTAALERFANGYYGQ
jgi:hypothetical protein